MKLGKALATGFAEETAPDSAAVPDVSEEATAGSAPGSAPESAVAAGAEPRQVVEAAAR